MSAGRRRERSGDIARLGFRDADRAESLVADPALHGLVDLADVLADDLLRAVCRTADPDLALLGLVRLMDAACEQPAASVDRLRDVLSTGGGERDRLLAVLGASRALGDQLTRHPEQWQALAVAGSPAPGEARRRLLSAVGADPDDDVPVASSGGVEVADALRVAYRHQVLTLAGRDLAGRDPLRDVEAVSRDLADLAGAALEAGLAIARADLEGHGRQCRIVVIAMGKCGGEELNYVSDVDVVYAVEPVDGVEETEALAVGTRLASGLARACSAVTPEGSLWPVDAALRPEGKDGPLVRTVASHRAYYERWASTWEFQALLKARPVAGDAALGQEYLSAIGPLVWQAADRDHFVEDVQSMRRRVEAHVPADDVERQLKLGPGGLRDVEFSLQLLQLVHGRTDSTLRAANTFEALAVLSERGYVGRDDAAALDTAYRFLRVLEHRVQLYRMRRTHVLPTADDDLRRLARASGLEGTGHLEKRWRETRVEVRRLHERLFYRPLLAAAARLSTDEVRLTPDAARVRLQALGYRDPAGALRHIQSLTDGVSRRAAIQKQLMPVMLGWFADGADPDAGLLAFRRVSDQLGSTHWYLKMLRDSGAAAERMAHMLASSRLAADLLERGPESTRWLGADDELAPRGRDALRTEVASAVRRAEDVAAGVRTARAVRRREVLRTAAADLAGLLGPEHVRMALTDATVAAIEGALQAVTLAAVGRRGGPLPVRLAVIGMGRLGGGELGYGSDADVVFVHSPVDGADEGEAQEVAQQVVSDLQKLLRATGGEPAVEIDANLRPEGRNGPLVRSLDSYAEYYRRWSLVWEAQALLRAVPVAGDPELGAAFIALVDPIRYPERGLSSSDVREVRRVKARIESERLPRGVDPRRHLKLGPGGLADVEWVAQLLQLRHAGDTPSLRTARTTGALRAAADAGLIDASDATVLVEAWEAASALRDAVTLWRGRAQDVVPTDRRELDGAGRLLGYPPGSGGLLEEDHRRRTRRARSVVERVFYA
ncbi:MAG TPA: bifunctional [glutamine synthetase] adenylyltransferase/[glutamine synthetase]-adenylyl-L-tyrosine phosphorylase [Actinomycetales bacterium]|nr:bifunctional [glutamine synthetase] adenylyltransferase/[glutamine synthetase]-adenylyl-L-tyrosine phosphorylase [Actinomycetales bacterium]